jgi:hypothetical protein
MAKIMYDLPKEYPQNEVAPHEVLITFNGDEQALAFREWWNSVGYKVFEKYYFNDPSGKEF